MDAQRYARVKAIFREAMRWAPEERAAVVRTLAEDDGVRGEVMSLLAHHDDAPLLREPARPKASEPAAPGPVAVERTLADVLRDERAGGAAGWTIERVVQVLGPIAEALAKGDVHGAVRADHVVVDGVVAELRGALGTSTIEGAEAAAAAPEQLSPALGPTGPWTDVYGLALLCVELLRGRPVTDGSAVAALARTRDEAAQPTPRAVGLELPPRVEAVLTMALAMRPMERYQDVRRFWTALRDSLVVVPAAASARLPAVSQRMSRTEPRRRWWLPVGAVVGVAAVIAIVVQRCG